MASAEAVIESTTTKEAAPSAIDKKLHQKFQGAIATIFRAVVAQSAFVRDWAVCMLFEHPVIEVGPPGVAKTLLARVTSRVLFGREAAVVTCFEDARPEDLLYDVGIAQLHAEGRSDYSFDVTPRPALTEPFVLVNEWNRLTPRTQNPFLGVFAEGCINVRGTTLRKARGKVVLDMNPYYGPMGDLATRDRFVACLFVEEIGIAERFSVATRKYAATHVDDLAETVAAVMTVDEMRAIWDDVRRVKVPPSELGRLVVAASVFSSCVHKLGSVSEAFRDRLKCEECAFRRHCLTQHLEHSVSPRLNDAVVLLAKAHAWFDGRDTVDSKRDLVPALRLATGHKLDLKETVAAGYPNVTAWFDRVVVPLLQSRKTEWAAARQAYEGIEKALRGGDAAKAGHLLQKYRTTTKDATALNLVTSFAEPLLEVHAGPTHLQAREKVDAMLSGEASYTKADLESIEADTSWLPDRQRNEIWSELEALKYRMKGTLVVASGEQLQALVNELAAIDPRIVKTLPSRFSPMTSRIEDNGTLVGTLTVTLRGSGGAEIEFEAQHSDVADVMARHGAE